MKTLGILGGVGPETTSEVYLSIIKRIKESGAETYPPIVIYNLPFPFAVEEDAIVHGRNSERMLPYLTDGARILEKAGADIGILPCNTLHAYMDDIRASSGLPFLSILEEVAASLKEKGITSAAILGTESTAGSRIYDGALSESGIATLYPEREDQDAINALILDLLNGVRNAAQKETLERISHILVQQGAECILLACTDLQLAARDMQSVVPVIDTTDILVQAAFRTMTQP